jgi:hypothetical protein
MRFAGLGGFPEGKVAGGVLLVLVQIDAGAVFHAAQVLFAQLAVLGEGGQAEVPGAVFGLVSGAGGGQFLDQLDHAGNVLGGAGDDLRALDAEGSRSSKKACSNRAVYSPMGMPAAAALRMILSSTSVMFMTWRTGCR